MVLVKTQAGQDALKDRQGGLTSRQRSAFILFDGKRSTGEVLAATAAMGITQDDVQAMIALGLLEPQSGSGAGAAVAAAAAKGTGQAVATANAVSSASSTSYEATVAMEAVQGSGRSDQQRYTDAYPIATELTAGLGLRGFRLNLAVEGAGSFSDLAALAPKIREAVGDAKFARFDKALFD
ncbi:hypothetical protein [Acidovorax sp.]|uniref:hypothetical protein n=1 Tax=Acidovorax sp. TaxID=1872122 RepID=UPI002ACEDDE0|nr:hypothetical protein [Acidovorax sp.]MDZ7866212.1 hypothetical protein [Acidovorax sp.]